MIPHLSALHAKATAPGPRTVAAYCERADARLEFCEKVIAAWPKIANALRCADAALDCLSEFGEATDKFVRLQRNAFWLG